jgi:hypothetical protein
MVVMKFNEIFFNLGTRMVLRPVTNASALKTNTITNTKSSWRRLERCAAR